MTSIKRLSETDVALYYKSPLSTLGKWANEYDIVTVDDRHVLLDKGMFSLVTDPRLKCGGRLPNAETRYPVCLWPMYLDGYKHHSAREWYNNCIMEVKGYLSHGSSVKRVGSISRECLVREIVELYSKALGFDANTVVDNYDVVESMHLSFLKRKEKDGARKWKTLCDRIPLNKERLSVISFILADTIPSIVHAFYSVIQAYYVYNKGKDKVGAQEVISCIVNNPPFYNLVRVAREGLIIKNFHEVRKGEKIVFPIRFWALRENGNRDKIKLAFGDGIHACPGRGVVVPIVLHLLRSFDKSYVDELEFKVKDDGNVYFIEDSKVFSYA